jgi:hypothetical protein
MNACTRIALFAALLLVGPTSAGRADTITSHFKVKGDTVTALFQATDPQNPCIEFQVSVVASELMQKLSPDGGPATTVRAMLVLSGADVCQGLDIMRGTGEVFEALFQVASDLESAALRATVPLFDIVGQQIVNFEINLTWSATGEPVVHHCTETIRDRDLGIFLTARFRGTHVPAQASGTVVGLGLNFTPEPSVSAEIQTQNDGTVTIQLTT